MGSTFGIQEDIMTEVVLRENGSKPEIVDTKLGKLSRLITTHREETVAMFEPLPKIPDDITPQFLDDTGKLVSDEATRFEIEAKWCKSPGRLQAIKFRLQVLEAYWHEIWRRAQEQLERKGVLADGSD